MKCIHIIILSCILLLSCKEKSSILVEVVDFKNLRTQEITDRLPAFYDEKHYVKLSSENPDYMLGNITKLIVDNDKIFAADFYDSKIVVFDMDGNALSNVGSRGRGHGEYYKVTDFDIDSKGQLHLIDGNRDVLMVYDSNYKHIKTIKLPFEVDIIKCLPDNRYLFGLSSWNQSKHSAKKVVCVDYDFNVINTFGKYTNTDDNTWIADYFFTSMRDGISYHRPVDDNIYFMDDKGTVRKTLYFDFGNSSIPEEHRSNLEPLINSGMISHYQTLMTRPIVQGNYALGIFFDRGDVKSFIIDLPNKILYTENSDNPTKLGTIIGADKNRLITYFPLISENIYPNDFIVSDVDTQQMAQLVCIYKFAEY